MGPARPSRSPRRVLLVVSNEMTASYLGGVKALFKGREDLVFFVTSAPGRVAEARTLAPTLEAPFVPVWSAAMQWWDLILFSAHHAPHRFHPAVPKLFIHHSYDSGKKANGADHRYGAPFVLDEQGESLYSAYLEMSEATRERVEAELPALAGRIRVVGDLMADRMFDATTRRDEVRAELGFSPEDRVVIMMSTWGAESMMEAMGETLIEAAEGLVGTYRFVLSTHPNHWTGPYSEKHPWGDRLLATRANGFDVITPDDDWTRFAIASDAAISDHTSLAVTYALLGRPLFFVPVDEAVMTLGTLGRQLYDALPRIDGAHQLENTLKTAWSDYPKANLETISRRIDSYPGEAATRIRAEVERLVES